MLPCDVYICTKLVTFDWFLLTTNGGSGNLKKSREKYRMSPKGIEKVRLAS
jgi:hypothetical protein